MRRHRTDRHGARLVACCVRASVGSSRATTLQYNGQQRSSLLYDAIYRIGETRQCITMWSKRAARMTWREYKELCWRRRGAKLLYETSSRTDYANCKPRLVQGSKHGAHATKRHMCAEAYNSELLVPTHWNTVRQSLALLAGDLMSANLSRGVGSL